MAKKSTSSQRLSDRNIFALAIPSEADLTAPVLVATELSRLYIRISTKIEELANQTRVIHGEDNHVTIIDHPDLKWWVNQQRLILTDIAKLNANLESKKMDQKISVTKIFLDNIQDKLPKEMVEKFIKMQMEQDTQQK